MAKGITIYKKDLLDRHLKVKDHSIAKKNQKESQNKIAVGFVKQYDKEKGIIVRQMQCVYFTAKNHISLEIYPKLCELIMPSQNQNIIAPKVVALPRQLVDNTNSTRSSYGTYQNHNLGKEMEKSITSIIKQELYQEINDSPFWSIMIDETTSISDEKHLAMVFKHFSHNVPVLSYIGLIELEDCTTDNILTQILEFIQNNGLNLDNLIHFGSDGASTMVVGKDAANEVQYFKKYEATCKELYSYFSGSYKRMLNLKMIQESNDDLQLAILNIINTRWLSLSNVVKNLYQILDSIIDALNFDSLHAGDQRDRDRAKKLLELVDSKFKTSTMYMADLTYLLTILCKTFQRDIISLSEVKSSLDATIATIKTQFISFDDQPPIYGTNLQQFLQNNPFYNNHIPDDFVHFAKALVHSLQARFPCNDLYDSMKILDPKELPLQESALSSYGIEELKLIFEHFGNQKHKSNGIPVQPLINSSECKKEWQMVKHIMKSIRNYDIIEGWHHIWSTRPQFKNQFPNVNILITNVETLDMHLTILLNAPDNIEEFNWDKAFNQWKNEHVRRVNTNNI
ncbi:unnamed protein product [Rhizophagus irregularis]|uniref:DUF4371 domain-containing protein n=1 Tax=Rhizophagus irregularis TaxID=588596 RepID=A0A915ZW75_9GLOM|nr:unnamed protein product [Rhizophagus irregularis]